MKHIILPSDFSENAWKAMCYAADLYHTIPCKFHIINVFHVPTTFAETGMMIPIEPLRKESEDQLDRLLNQFKDLDHNDQTTFEMKSTGVPLVDTIRNLEEELESDSLIIMGTQGVSGLSELLFGTITSSVIRKCKSPVICVPNRANLKTPKNIMFGMDDLLISSKTEIAPMIELAKNWNANISTVHINELDKSSGEKTPKEIVSDYYLDEIEHSFHTISGEYIQDELSRFAKLNRMDLIVLTRRDHGFWNNLFRTSLTKNMAFYSEVPLLVLRD